MPDQNDNPLAFEPINEPIIISKVNNENEQNTLSEMLNRQKKSYDDIQSIKYQLADTGNKSNIFQMIREQRDLSKKINTNISNLTTSIPNAFSHLKNEISQQNDYYRKQENRSYSQNEQIIKKLEQTNDKLEKQITQIDKLKKQENITGITIQPIHQIVQGFSDIKKEIDELKKWRKSQQTMSTGGYTGGSNVTKPQGIVHEGEYVVPQWMVNQNQQIIKQLESIRTQNKNYAVGGYVSNIQDQKTIQALNQLKSQYGSKVAKMAQLPISKDANTINLQITILSQLLAKDTGGESFEITPQVQNILNYLSSEKIMQQLNPDTQPTVLDMVSKIPEFNKFTNSNNFSKTKKVNELKNEQKQLAGSIAKHKQFSELQKNIGFSNTDDFQYYLQLAFDQIQGMEDPQSSNLFINKFRKFNKILGLQFKPLTSIVESVNALAFKPTDYFGKETDNLVKSFFNLIRNRYTSLDDIRVPSFQTGGYTGQGNPREIQGLVHKDEFVLPSNTKSLWSIFTSTPVNLLKEILYYTKIDQIQSQSQLQIDRKLIAIEDKKYRDYLYDRNKQQKEKQLGSPEEIQLEQQKQQGVSGTAGGFLTGLLGAKLQASLGGIFGIQKGQGAFGNIKNVLSSIQGRVLGGVGGQIQVGTDQYSQYNRSTQIDPITGQKTTDWGNVAQGTVQGSQEGGWLNQLGQQGKYQQLGTQIGGPLGTLVGGGVGLLLGGLGQDRIKQFGEGQQELFTGIKVTEDQINEELQRLQKDPKFQNITEKELRKIQKTEAEQKKNPVVYTIRKGIEYMFNPFKMQGDILNNQFDIQETIDNKYAELKRDPKYKDMSDQQVMELQKKQYKEEHPILSFFSGIQTGISGFISNVWGTIVNIFTGTKKAQDIVNKDIENINNLMIDNNIDFSLPEVTSTTNNGLTINTIKGYSQGGFTDNVQPNIPVGVVHGGEYVVPQTLVPKYKPLLTTIEKDRLQNLPGYQEGGLVLTPDKPYFYGEIRNMLNAIPTSDNIDLKYTINDALTDIQNQLDDSRFISYENLKSILSFYNLLQTEEPPTSEWYLKEFTKAPEVEHNMLKESIWFFKNRIQENQIKLMKSEGLPDINSDLLNQLTGSITEQSLQPLFNFIDKATDELPKDIINIQQEKIEYKVMTQLQKDSWSNLLTYKPENISNISNLLTYYTGGILSNLENLGANELLPILNSDAFNFMKDADSFVSSNQFKNLNISHEVQAYYIDDLLPDGPVKQVLDSKYLYGHFIANGNKTISLDQFSKYINAQTSDVQFETWKKEKAIDKYATQYQQKGYGEGEGILGQQQAIIDRDYYPITEQYEVAKSDYVPEYLRPFVLSKLGLAVGTDKIVKYGGKNYVSKETLDNMVTESMLDFVQKKKTLEATQMQGLQTKDAYFLSRETLSPVLLNKYDDITNNQFYDIFGNILDKKGLVGYSEAFRVLNNIENFREYFSELGLDLTPEILQNKNLLSKAYPSFNKILQDPSSMVDIRPDDFEHLYLLDLVKDNPQFTKAMLNEDIANKLLDKVISTEPNSLANKSLRQAISDYFDVDKFITLDKLKEMVDEDREERRYIPLIPDSVVDLIHPNSLQLAVQLQKQGGLTYSLLDSQNTVDFQPISGIQGFYTGGFTPDIGTDKIAGVVHGGEYVVPQNLVDKYKPELSAIEKDRLQNLPGYQTGGIVLTPDKPYFYPDIRNKLLALPTSEDLILLDRIKTDVLPDIQKQLDDSNFISYENLKSILSFYNLLQTNETPTSEWYLKEFTKAPEVEHNMLKESIQFFKNKIQKNQIQLMESENLPGISGDLLNQLTGGITEQSLQPLFDFIDKATKELPEGIINKQQEKIEYKIMTQLQKDSWSNLLTYTPKNISNISNLLTYYTGGVLSNLENLGANELLPILNSDAFNFMKDVDRFANSDQFKNLNISQEVQAYYIDDLLPDGPVKQILDSKYLYNHFTTNKTISLDQFSRYINAQTSDVEFETWKKGKAIDKYATQYQVQKKYEGEGILNQQQVLIDRDYYPITEQYELVKSDYVPEYLKPSVLSKLGLAKTNGKAVEYAEEFYIPKKTLNDMIIEQKIENAIPMLKEKDRYLPESISLEEQRSEFELSQNDQINLLESDLELINFDDLLSEELKDKTKTNLPLQDRENLNNSKIGILNYFIPEKTKEMPEAYHFELRKAQNQSLLDKIKASYGQYYNTNWIPPGFVEKMFVYDENGNNIIDDQDFVRAITLTPNSFAYNTVDDMGDRINNIVDTGRQFYAVWNRIFNDKQQLSQLLDPNLDIKYGETNFEGLPIFITEEKFGMLRNSEISGNMVPNNYPNSDFYSVFPNSNIVSEPKLANISPDIPKKKISSYGDQQLNRLKLNSNIAAKNEKLYNSKIGILNYFIPEKTEEMSEVYHFALNKAQNEYLLAKIKASYGQYYNTNWIPPGFVEKMFVYDENGNNIIDDRDFVRAITLTPNSFADNTIDDTGKQFYSVWNQIFNDKQQLSQLLDPNLDIRYGETNFKGLPIFITEEKFDMLRNSEIFGNMVTNNYPNSDFYSVFPDSEIFSKPKLTKISDISNTHTEKEIQPLKSNTISNINIPWVRKDLQPLIVETLPTTPVDDQYSKSFNNILNDKIKQIYNQYSNIYPRRYSNAKYTPEQQQIVEWYEDNLIGTNPSKYFSDPNWNKDLEQQQKNVIKARKDQVEFERKVNKNNNIPYDKYLQGLTEKNIIASLLSKINREIISQEDVISLLPVNPKHLEDKLTSIGQFSDKINLSSLLQNYQNQLKNNYNSGLIKIDDDEFQNSPQYQWWLNDLAANTGLDSQFDYLNGKVYSQLDEYIYSRFKNRIGEIGGDYDKVNILRDLSSKGIKEKLQYAFGVFWPSKKLTPKIEQKDFGSYTIDDQEQIQEEILNGKIPFENIELLDEQVKWAVIDHMNLTVDLENYIYSKIKDHLVYPEEYLSQFEGQSLENELLKLQWFYNRSSSNTSSQWRDWQIDLYSNIISSKKYVPDFLAALGKTVNFTTSDILKLYSPDELKKIIPQQNNSTPHNGGGSSDGLKFTQEFRTGGYTGDGNFNEVQGIVHKGEYVVPKDIVDDNPILINELEKMRLRQEDVDNTTKYANQSYQDIQEVEELLEPLISTSDLIHNDNEKTVELLSKILEAILNNKPVEIPDELNVKGISELINMLKLNNKPQINNFIQPIARSNNFMNQNSSNNGNSQINNFIQSITRSNNFMNQNSNNNGNSQSIPLNVPLQ